ncbi:MAG: FKBP12-associated protein [Trichoglossum hirsutum]|nr:MAG: FKBP12-associated protein [Trichoglossum hirsutum]
MDASISQPPPDVDATASEPPQSGEPSRRRKPKRRWPRSERGEGATPPGQPRSALTEPEALLAQPVIDLDLLVAPAPPPQVQYDQLYGIENPAMSDTTSTRGLRHRRGRGGISRGQRTDGDGVISNSWQSRPQQGREGNSEERVGDGADTSQTPRSGSRSNRGRVPRTLPARIPPARRFGSQLTANDSGSAPSAPRVTLQADAQEFHPGQPLTQRGGTSSSSPRNRHIQTAESLAGRAPRARERAKSSAADIATRTHEDIANGIYECPICTSELGRNSKVWSCEICWTVFHLSCIKKWSNNAVSTQQYTQQSQDEEISPILSQIARKSASGFFHVVTFASKFAIRASAPHVHRLSQYPAVVVGLRRRLAVTKEQLNLLNVCESAKQLSAVVVMNVARGAVHVLLPRSLARALRLNIYVRESAVGPSNVGITLVLSFAIKALVVAVEMLFSTRLAVTAAARFYSPLYRAGRNNRLAATTVRDKRNVDTLKWIITATVTTKLVQSARS